MGCYVTIQAVIPVAARAVATDIVDVSHIKFIAWRAIVATLLRRFVIAYAIATAKVDVTYGGPEPPSIPATLLSSPVTAFLGAGTALLLRVVVAFPAATIHTA
jgi:hypothetical protein